jgi:hypothetical protein
MCIHHEHTVLLRPEDSIRSPGTRTTNTMWVLGTELRSSARATSVITAQLSLQPCVCLVFLFFGFWFLVFGFFFFFFFKEGKRLLEKITRDLTLYSTYIKYFFSKSNCYGNMFFPANMYALSTFTNTNSSFVYIISFSFYLFDIIYVNTKIYICITILLYVIDTLISII